MKVYTNFSLKKFNTFRVDVEAKYFCEVKSEEELGEVIKKYPDEKRFILGEGANTLFTKNFDGLVIRNSMKGIKKIESANNVILEVGAGENWHGLVMYSVENGWGGIENLVYIPGTVGAAPVQNIAAYGQNFEDVFVSLDVVELASGKKYTFSKEECEFEYRNSRFKSVDFGKFAITTVRLKLSKNPKINLSYFETGKTYAKNVSLAHELENISKPTIKDVAMAVMKIRKSKLPDVTEVGTAGSVFKNPVVTRAKYKEMKREDPDLQSYPAENLKYKHDVAGDFVKIPAGRLLDNLGWKGKRIGNVGTYKTQALAVVNYGATPQKILEFMNQMKKVVFDNYKIKLEEEILIV
ncbi:UDP-N-acetylenolpyruvoylglucosamine reductase [Candidatus Woesebacteria bacterium RIFCSPHIGHO2_01_FULL_44_21]|uniref:UDP-N-acetylenolpyruvoylglucosamine reductase n=1 Tax=Candidatus Woesebacteria bacterium RIFCSPHIGHO2_01_FULL_44_21 TaxID=1802503 RepID=A0A1F7YVA9_9BACT|nr:MAG: UDP-N-acetylenolpyruvoylglucosamine reductase [Candidatus Woesebacteria bacterium RIFCSPHIGHO2_01_FULL_44_21]